MIPIGSEFIGPQELKDKLDSGEKIFLLDVREPSEFEGWHIGGSINIPITQLMERLGEIPKESDIVTVCLHGVRSERVTQFLAQTGYKAKTMMGGMVSWNGIYDICEIPITHSFQLLQFRRVGKGCLSYLLISGDKAIAIDPTIDTQAYIKQANDRNIDAIDTLDTHIHADHISGGRELAETSGGSYFEPINLKLPFRVGNMGFNPISTPGHTPESITLLLENLAFTGDTLFVESVGRPDLGQDPKTHAAILWATLQKLLTLPDNTIILPAHFSSPIIKAVPIMSSVEQLKRNLLPLQMSREKFSEWIAQYRSPKPANFETIKNINEGNLRPTDLNDIRELEIGPNRCAV